MKTMVTEWVDKDLIQLPYFHGYLPREDTPSLLSENGDFILRCTEDNGKKELVISVLFDPENKCASGNLEKEAKSSMVRNIIIRRVQGGALSLDQCAKFYELSALIQNYHMNGIPLDNKTKFVTLSRGVRLGRWELYHSEVSVGKILGKGAFGAVHQGVLRRRKKNKAKDANVAIKTMHLTTQQPNLKLKAAEIMHEARIMRNLSHPNVVKVYGVAVTEQPMHIVLELVRGGALDKYLNQNSASLDKNEKFQMMMGACWGIEFLHGAEIIHRDIAARNCLYSEDKTVKISDFGLSRKGTHYQMKTAMKMPVKWMAPESIKKFEFTDKTDVYSFGILIWEIFACKEPYPESTNTDAKKLILTGKTNAWPSDTPANLSKYVNEKIWAIDPRTRVNMNTAQKWLGDLTGLQLLFDDGPSSMLNPQV